MRSLFILLALACTILRAQMESGNPNTGNAFGGVLPLSRPFMFPEFGSGAKLSDAYKSQGLALNEPTAPKYYDPDFQSQLYPKSGAAPHVGAFGGRVVGNGHVPVGAKLQMVQNSGVGMANLAMSDIASDDISIIINANAALRRGNFESAESILGRPCTIEEISNKTITPTLRLNNGGQKVAVSNAADNWLTGQVAPGAIEATPVAGAAPADAAAAIGAAVGAAPPPDDGNGGGGPAPAEPAPGPPMPDIENKYDEDAAPSGAQEEALREAMINAGINPSEPISSDELVRAMASSSPQSGSSSSAAPGFFDRARSLMDSFRRVAAPDDEDDDDDDGDDDALDEDDDGDGDFDNVDDPADNEDESVEVPDSDLVESEYGDGSEEFEEPENKESGASFGDVLNAAGRQTMNLAGDMGSAALSHLKKRTGEAVGSLATGARSLASSGFARVSNALSQRAAEAKEREEKHMEAEYLRKRDEDAMAESARSRADYDKITGEANAARQQAFLHDVHRSLGGEYPEVIPEDFHDRPENFIHHDLIPSAPDPDLTAPGFYPSLTRTSATARIPMAPPVVPHSSRREELAPPSTGASHHRAEARSGTARSTVHLGDMLGDIAAPHALRPVRGNVEHDSLAPALPNSGRSVFLPTRPSANLSRSLPTAESIRVLREAEDENKKDNYLRNSITARRNQSHDDDDDQEASEFGDEDDGGDGSVAPAGGPVRNRRNPPRNAAPHPGDFVGMRSNHPGDHGAGIGQLAVNIPKLLRHNVLSVRYAHNGRTVKGLPNRQVGGALRQQILNLAHGIPADMSELTAEDAHYLQHFHRRATPAGRKGHLKFRPIPNSGPSRASVEHRIQVLMGELAAGNDTAGVVLRQEKELMNLLHKAVAKGTLSPANYNLITRTYFSR